MKDASRARRWTHRLLAGLLVVAGAVGGAGCLFNGPRYQGPVSEHFDGEHFHHPWGGEQPPSRLELVREVLAEERGAWGEYTELEPGPPPPRAVGAGALRVTFINHATTLLQADGVNVLTDPIYAERTSPVGWAGPRRVHPPGIRFEQLPPIHAVVVSHNHYDHLDLPTLKRLAEAHHPRIFVPLGNKALLQQAGIGGVEELDWWQSPAQLAPGVRLTAVPAQHRANRGLTDSAATLWAGYVLSSSGGHAYFAGDTGFGPHLAQVAERFSPLRLALLPIGAFRPRGLAAEHMGPEEALAAHHALGASTSVAIHHGTFPLALDGQHEARHLLLRLLARQQPRPRFWVLGPGEGRFVPPASSSGASALLDK